MKINEDIEKMNRMKYIIDKTKKEMEKVKEEENTSNVKNQSFIY